MCRCCITRFTWLDTVCLYGNIENSNGRNFVMRNLCQHSQSSITCIYDFADTHNADIFFFYIFPTMSRI